MPLPLLLGLAASIPQIVGGVVANRSHRKLAKEMEGMTMEMPSGMTEAEKLYRQIAGGGMPGYEKAKTDISGTTSQTLNSYRDVVDNPAMLLGALSDSQTNTNAALSDLAVKDAMFKLQNEGNLASFLSGPKANTQMSIEQYNNQMKLGAGQERQAGTAEMLKGITGGIAGGITGYSTGKMLGAQKGAYDAWDQFMKSGSVIQPVASVIGPQASSNAAITQSGQLSDRHAKLLEFMKASGVFPVVSAASEGAKTPATPYEEWNQYFNTFLSK